MVGMITMALCLGSSKHMRQMSFPCARGVVQEHLMGAQAVLTCICGESGLTFDCSMHPATVNETCYCCDAGFSCTTSPNAAITYNNENSCDFTREFRVTEATSTAFAACQPLSVCVVGQRYQVTVPTTTTNRVCRNVTTCIDGQQYQSSPATATTDARCSPVRSCTSTEYEVAAATLTNNTQCQTLTACQSPKVPVVLATSTSDRVCGFREGNPVTRLSSNDWIGVGLGGLVVFALLMVGLSYFRKVRGRAASQHAFELLQAHEEMEDLAGKVERMMGAWQIPWEHIVLGPRVAEGTYGEVHAATWSNLTVAVKLLKYQTHPRMSEPEYASAVNDINADLAKDFQKECEMLQVIRHPNLIIFYGAGSTNSGRRFLVVEFLSVGSLRKALLDKTREIVWDVRTSIALDVACGMQHLHSRSIVHRDLKSDNVLLDNRFTAKVGDFGTARLVHVDNTSPHSTDTRYDSEAHRDATQGVGTPLWMAPEVFTGNVTAYGPAVDVYSYGIIMYELATRALPWTDFDHLGFHEFRNALADALLAGQRPELPTGFDDEHSDFAQVMRNAWATHPSHRPTFVEIVESLTALSQPARRTANTSAVTATLMEPLLPS